MVGRRLQSTLYSGQYHGECTNHAVLLYRVYRLFTPTTLHNCEARTVRSVNLDRPGGAEPAACTRTRRRCKAIRVDPGASYLAEFHVQQARMRDASTVQLVETARSLEQKVHLQVELCEAGLDNAELDSLMLKVSVSMTEFR